jgi:hypothetical protein
VQARRPERPRHRAIPNRGSVSVPTREASLPQCASSSLGPSLTRHSRCATRPLTLLERTTERFPDIPVVVATAVCASTLMMTVAGSIISAWTDFALKELPKQIVSRQGEAPKA